MFILLVLEIKMQKTDEQLFEGLTMGELFELWTNMYPEGTDNNETKKVFIELDEDSCPVATIDFENN